MRAGPSLATVVWMAARCGRADKVRITMTTACSTAAMLALLSATAVAWIGPDDGPYTSQLLMEPGLHQGVVMAAVLLSIPVLALVGQCSRIGAPARDRRLAAYRLAGASAHDVARVAVAETFLSAGIGSLLGLAGYLFGRVLLDGPLTVVAGYTERTVSRSGPDSESIVSRDVVGSVHLLPTDSVAPWWVLALTVAALPCGAALLGRLALRRVVVSPLGVSRRQATMALRGLPAALFVAGTAGLAGFSGLRAALGTDDEPLVPLAVVMTALFLATSIGLLLGIAAISSYIGERAASRTRHPALLIAGRRLAAAPFTSSRANAVVLLVVLVGGVTQGVRAAILTQTATSGEPIYRETLDLVNLVLLAGLVIAAGGVLVHVAETVVTGRQSFAALVATGTPRSVLRRSLLLEAVLPLVPTTVVAAAAGLLAARGVFGTTYTRSGGTVRRETVQVVAVPVPWLELSALVGVALGVTALMAVGALTLVRRGTDVRELRVG